jgi:hypothetical protein
VGRSKALLIRRLAVRARRGHHCHSPHSILADIRLRRSARHHGTLPMDAPGRHFRALARHTSIRQTRAAGPGGNPKSAPHSENSKRPHLARGQDKHTELRLPHLRADLTFPRLGVVQRARIRDHGSGPGGSGAPRPRRPRRSPYRMLEGRKSEDSHVRPGLAGFRRASALVINPATRTRFSRRRCSLTAEACSVQEHRTDPRVNLARGFFGHVILVDLPLPSPRAGRA